MKHGLALLAATLVAVLAPRGAAADEVEDLISLVREKPAGMDRVEWKVERRAAAKELASSGDPRAVDTLIWVVETEEFDIIAEHAIEGLGKLGDDRAVSVLQKVYADERRERYVRDLAAAALRKLGATPGATGGGGDDDDDDDDDDGTGAGGVLVGGGGLVVGGSDKSELPEAPDFEADVLGSIERLTFAIGSASFQWDTVRERPSFEADVSGEYLRATDTPSLAYDYGGRVDIAAGAIDFEGSGSASSVIRAGLDLAGGARIYFGGTDVYGMARGTINASVTSLNLDRPGPGNNTSETLFGFDGQLLLAFGYGRVLEYGEALRLRRIEMVLEEARARGRPITPDLAEKIMEVWWSLRGETGYHQRLVATVKMLREAGVLLGEPDASLTYKMLEVLRDGQLAHRPSGIDAYAGIAEGYVVRDDAIPAADGRIETFLLGARFGLQADNTVDELVGDAFLRVRLFSGDEQAPLAAGIAGAWRHYVYGTYWDPTGAFEVTANAALADDGEGFDVATRVGGTVGWLWIPNRASRFRLAAEVAFETEELFVGAVFEAAYGLLDVSYLGGGRYKTLK